MTSLVSGCLQIRWIDASALQDPSAPALHTLFASWRRGMYDLTRISRVRFGDMFSFPTSSGVPFAHGDLDLNRSAHSTRSWSACDQQPLQSTTQNMLWPRGPYSQLCSKSVEVSYPLLYIISPIVVSSDSLYMESRAATISHSEVRFM